MQTAKVIKFERPHPPSGDFKVFTAQDIARLRARGRVWYMKIKQKHKDAEACK